VADFAISVHCVAMEIIEMLGLALGFGVLAGVNLYMTVFVTGLAIKFEWLSLAEKYTDLQILENPWILGVSGVLFLVETLADKIPWVDSGWDVIHTAIRPIGGCLLALAALGEMDPVAGVLAALFCGGTSFVSHAAKAGTRALVNLSPEPVSNILVSSTEDILVMGGLGMLALSPTVSFFLFLGIALLCAFVAWKTFGFVRKLWKKFRGKKKTKQQAAFA